MFENLNYLIPSILLWVWFFVSCFLGRKKGIGKSVFDSLPILLIYIMLHISFLIYQKL